LRVTVTKAAQLRFQHRVTVHVLIAAGDVSFTCRTHRNSHVHAHR